MIKRKNTFKEGIYKYDKKLSILRHLIIFIFIFFILAVFHLDVMGQIIVKGTRREISDFIAPDKYDSLKVHFGKHKEIPEEFSLQILYALAHYPELKDVPIRFIKKKAFPPLSALPSIPSMLNPYEPRGYRVVISIKSSPEMEAILLNNLPLNAQIGVIGHELAHVADYQTKSFGEFIPVALNYGINPIYHAWFEKSTDKRTIEHGLGWELYAYSVFVRTLYGSTEDEVNLSDDFYMHFNEILFEMETSKSYNYHFLPNAYFLRKSKKEVGINNQ